MEKQLQQALTTTYPNRHKTQQAKDNEWVRKQTWSRAGERQVMEYMQKRRTLKARLEQLTKQKATTAKDYTQENATHMETKYWGSNKTTTETQHTRTLNKKNGNKCTRKQQRHGAVGNPHFEDFTNPAESQTTKNSSFIGGIQQIRQASLIADFRGEN